MLNMEALIHVISELREKGFHMSGGTYRALQVNYGRVSSLLCYLLTTLVLFAIPNAHCTPCVFH